MDCDSTLDELDRQYRIAIQTDQACRSRHAVAIRELRAAQANLRRKPGEAAVERFCAASETHADTLSSTARSRSVLECLRARMVHLTGDSHAAD